MFGRAAERTVGGTPETIYRFDRPQPGPKTFVRGSFFASIPTATRDYLGPEGWSVFLGQLDPASAAVLKSEFVALAWYPFSIVADVARAVDATGKKLGKKNALAHMSEANLNYATRGLFRAIFKIGSPEFFIDRSDMIWRKCYSNGEMAVTCERGNATVKLRGVPDMTPHYSISVLHSLEAVLRMAGARVTKAEMTRDISKGDAFSEYSYRWL